MKRQGRSQVTAQLLVLFLNRTRVDTDSMKELVGVGSKQLSVMLDRLMKKGLIKRVEKGVYTLKTKGR